MSQYRVLVVLGCFIIGSIYMFSTYSTLNITEFDPVPLPKKKTTLSNKTDLTLKHLQAKDTNNRKFQPYKPQLPKHNKNFPVVHEKCSKIPSAPNGTMWIEEKYLNEPEVTNVLEMADGKRSKIWIESGNVVRVGDSVHVKLQLYDGFGNPRNTGGDLPCIKTDSAQDHHTLMDLFDETLDSVTHSRRLQSIVRSTLKYAITVCDSATSSDTHTLEQIKKNAARFANTRYTVRVWVNEQSKGASCNAKVIDHLNGSYSAIIKAFWVGRPKIMAAIIQPRQVIATAMKRRYICPPVVINTAIFQHPDKASIQDETPCNYDPQVPGYPEICNLTAMNYGSPWYCGKPTTPKLFCNHWTKVSIRHVWFEGIEQQLMSNVTLKTLDVKYKAVILPTKATFRVNPGVDHQQREIATDKCNEISWKKTWSSLTPSGYLFNRKWNLRHCIRNASAFNVPSCMKDTHIRIIGDSTTRQIFKSLEIMLPCTWKTVPWEKARKPNIPAVCSNRKWNYTITWNPHQVPLCTPTSELKDMKSLTEHLNEIPESSKTIVIFHMFGHFLNHHSHVFYETLHAVKTGIVAFLRQNKNTTIILKGPHAFSFHKKAFATLWMPESYADIYSKIIHEEFRELSDRVIYLDPFDITVSTEQWSIHPDDYIVDELSRIIFSYVCPY